MTDRTPSILATAPVGKPPAPRWLPEARPVWQRYAFAIAFTLLAVWMRVELAPAESGGRFVTAALAVALSALFGGLGPGLCSTVLGMVLVNYFLVPPYFSPAIEATAEAFWLNLWHLITQMVVVLSIWVMQRQYRRLQENHERAQLHQQHFLATFEHAASGITHVSPQGQLLRVNLTFCHMVGYTRDELLRLGFQDITCPEDLAPDLALLQECLDGKRSSYSLEKRYRHKDGRMVWAQLTVALVRTADQRPDYFISVAQDITGVKATEEALRTNERLLRQAQTLAGFASWEADIATDHFRTIDATPLRLGLPTGGFTGAQLRDMVHPDERDRFISDWLDALRGARPYNATYRAVFDGEDRWFSVRAEFERDASGRAVRALGVTKDITQRTLAQLEILRLNASLEQRIRERTQQLEAAYKDLESYSYAVAHDLRSPLRIINGFAQALEDDHPELVTASQGHLRRIRAASKKMGDLIDGLLKLSHYARSDVIRVPVKLSLMARRLLDDLARAEPERQVTWAVDPDIEVYADPALIEAVLQNLLHNAWKYTAKVPNASIHVYRVVENGQRKYCVSDNGAGFDMTRAGKLFQPFQRLHPSTEFVGLGIGLATARRIVLRHGGELTVQSAPGQGATFAFTLPDSGMT
jgi:PAS domain S-box-containing protein